MWFLHLFLLLVIYSFGPGLLLVRPLRLAPRERLIVAVGVGLFLNYVLAFCIFAGNLPLIAHTGVTVVALALGLFGWRDWLRLLRSGPVRRLLLNWGLLLLWGFLLLSMIRNFGGGTWGGDWVEHYQRSLFFFGGEDFAFKFIDQYPLPMRPPMMNVLTASLLAQAVTLEQTLEAYQLSFLFLNSLVYLPLAVLLPRLVRLSPRLTRRACWTLTALLAASPMFDQNLTYTWTKLFAAFYALAGMAVYLRAWRRTRNDQPAIADKRSSLIVQRSAFFGFPLAFALLCIGFLVHFSVGPYGLFLGLHYLLAVWWRRPKRFAEAGLIAAVSLAVFAAWFPWSVAYYGAKTTFTSTSAVSDSVKMTPAENAANIAKNAVNTLVPTIVQQPWLIWSEDVAQRDMDLDQPSFAGRLRDFMFLIYQVTLPGGLGLVGSVLTIYLLWRVATKRDFTDRPVRRFWIAFIVVVFAAGVAVYGGVDRFGVAHICLQPMVLCGVALLAGAAWRISLRLRALLIVGLLADFGLGVMLQMALQHYVPKVVPIVSMQPDGTPRVVAYDVKQSPDTPSRAAQKNASDRLFLSGVSPRDFWGDRFQGGLPALQVSAGAMMGFFLFMGFAGPSRLRNRVAAVAAPNPAARPKRKKSKR